MRNASCSWFLAAAFGLVLLGCGGDASAKKPDHPSSDNPGDSPGKTPDDDAGTPHVDDAGTPHVDDAGTEPTPSNTTCENPESCHAQTHVGSEGGMVQLNDGSVVIELPPGALAEGKQITIAPAEVAMPSTS